MRVGFTQYGVFEVLSSCFSPMSFCVSMKDIPSITLRLPVVFRRSLLS